ncbi:flagellar hook-basal body complex protein FliE [Bacillus marinisedimentorum]|uniref:flagellar hook-basal body complex protein FliE n=1 Tax=Bacillus marinisedimentorum TaxID=1821260 RepID=UPI0009F6B591|nr:flagellar hook-basal body complex protein FliE [Bacillus marinisedimentorum]
MEPTGAVNLFQQSAYINNPSANKTAAKSIQSFSDALKNSINDVNSIQKESDVATTRLANGQIDDLHQVMITAKKASISLQTTVEIRNKAIEAYQEIMRMQI